MNKMAGLLGIAKRAGKTVSGAYSIEKALASKGAVKLLIIAADASESTKRSLMKAAELQNVPTGFALTKAELGRSIGRDYSAALSILDAGFGKALEKFIRSETV